MKKLIILLTVFTFLFTTKNLSAATSIVPGLPTPESFEEAKVIKIKIIIIIVIKKKNGKQVVGEISDIRLADGSALGKNEHAATAEIKGNTLNIMFETFKKKMKLNVPKSFTLSKEVSEKLGASKSVVMSGGSTMLTRTNKLGNFEIQD